MIMVEEKFPLITQLDGKILSCQEVLQKRPKAPSFREVAVFLRVRIMNTNMRNFFSFISGFLFALYSVHVYNTLDNVNLDGNLVPLDVQDRCDGTRRKLLPDVPDSMGFVHLIKHFITTRALPIGGGFSSFRGNINANFPKRNFKPPFVGKSISRRLQHEFIQSFVNKYKDTHSGSRCLDWDGWYGGTLFADICDTVDVIEYRTPFGEQKYGKRLNSASSKRELKADHLYYADIHNMTKCGVPVGVYDIIIANSVFEHLYNPFIAIQEIEKVMKPNGLLFWHTPFMFEQHGVPHDYFRYTVAGARNLVESAGLEVLLAEPDGGYAAVLSNLLGIGSQHWSSKDLHDGETSNDLFPYMSTRMIASKSHNIS